MILNFFSRINLYFHGTIFYLSTRPQLVVSFILLFFFFKKKKRKGIIQSFSRTRQIGGKKKPKNRTENRKSKKAKEKQNNQRNTKQSIS